MISFFSLSLYISSPHIISFPTPFSSFALSLFLYRSHHQLPPPQKNPHKRKRKRKRTSERMNPANNPFLTRWPRQLLHHHVSGTVRVRPFVRPVHTYSTSVYLFIPFITKSAVHPSLFFLVFRGAKISKQTDITPIESNPTHRHQTNSSIDGRMGRCMDELSVVCYH